MNFVVKTKVKNFPFLRGKKIVKIPKREVEFPIYRIKVSNFVYIIFTGALDENKLDFSLLQQFLRA
jgi:hypothetical protein